MQLRITRLPCDAVGDLIVRDTIRDIWVVLEQIQNLSSVHTARNVCATDQWGRHSCLPFLQTNSESARMAAEMYWNAA